MAGIACQPYKELYKRTEQIVCKVDGPGVAKEKSGPILVKISDFRGESSERYKFVDPELTGISPQRGPQSGGTRVEIQGRHMNAGSRIQAFIGDSPCEIVDTYPDKAICVTGPSNRQNRAEVKMIFDKGSRKLKRKKYKFVEDPKIDYVHSGISGVNKVPKTIASGGINTTVIGFNFKFIKHPKMYVVYQDKRYSGECDVFNNTLMYCSSPKIQTPVPFRNLDNPTPQTLDYGFIMDDVKRVQNLQEVLQGSQSHVLLYPDPEFEPFEEPNGIKSYKTDYLLINGKNLNRASSESDMKVMIGTEICNVTSLSENQLTCKPPVEQPPVLINGEKSYDETPDVVVTIGESGKIYQIGKLSYNLGDGKLPQPVLIGVIAGACFLLLVVFIFLILYRKKSSESHRVLKGKNFIIEHRIPPEFFNIMCYYAFSIL